ncbi:hypothetical protein QTL86_19380 [Cellulosilyticum sp. ST5]|uniref:hypothetical protein n=1 Tax=Cellulosilyticum sp. ST5 TaxID=3055805 RepID=UPI003977770F
MSISNVFLTNQGRILQAKCMLGKTITFTKIILGDGELQGKIVQELTAVISPKMNVPITKFLKLDDGKVKIGGKFNNTGLNTGFYYRELGLIATDPDTNNEVLYCYGNAGVLAEYISGQGSEIIEKQIDIIALVGNKADVTATIEDSLLGVSPEDLEAHNESETAHPAIRALVQNLFSGLKLTWDNITGKPNTFPPPVASSTVLGGVKQGNNITIEADGTISGAAPYTHPNTHPASMITGLPTSLPANGGNADTVDGTHAWYMQTLSASGTTHGASEWLAKIQHNVDSDSYFKLVCGDGGIGVKVDNTNLVKGRDLSAELDSLKSTVVSGKQSVANAINGKLGTALSNQTPFDDMAYYIANGLISSPTSATCGSFTLTFGNNFSTRSCYIVRSSYKVYCYSLYGVAVSYQVYKKPSGGSLSLLYSGTISTASPSYTQLTDGDNTAVYFIFFGTSGVTLHATNTNGSGNATFDYCI